MQFYLCPCPALNPSHHITVVWSSAGRLSAWLMRLRSIKVCVYSSMMLQCQRHSPFAVTPFTPSLTSYHIAVWISTGWGYGCGLWYFVPFPHRRFLNPPNSLSPLLHQAVTSSTFPWNEREFCNTRPHQNSAAGSAAWLRLIPYVVPYCITAVKYPVLCHQHIFFQP